MAACSDIRVNKEMRSIEVTTPTILAENSIGKASDCVNGTWLEDLGVTDYNTITKKYLQYRYKLKHHHKPNQLNNVESTYTSIKIWKNIMVYHVNLMHKVHRCELPKLLIV